MNDGNSTDTVLSTCPSFLLECRCLRRAFVREINSLSGVLNFRLLFWQSWARLLPEFSLESVRAQFYRFAGCHLARGVAIQGNLLFTGKGQVVSRLHVGTGTIIAPRVTFNVDAEITIGRNVNLGPGAVLYTATHALGFGSRRMNLSLASRPISIENGAWVGMFSVILPGVTLGAGSVVSAGAVVTEDVPSHTLVAGNPATVQQVLPFANR